ncbi:MAG: MG2 domain-containing protein, partial [Armatimonadota bacterium]|nr:MG2 domain-containing protein [Armatimonadota bacterium]
TPTGMVTGVCTDAVTGTPLADVPISLSRHTDDDSEGASDMPTDAVQNALGGTTPPAGWKQDSRDDSQYGFAGASTTPHDEFQTHSDAQGRFTLKRVPTGEYDVYYASSSGHHLDKPVSVVVTDNQTATLTLPLMRDKPNLRFINAVRNWTPKESVAVSLNGLLQTRSVQFSIERLDVAGTLTRRPADLTHLDAQDSDSENKPSQWPGQFAPVRHWTYALTKTDPEGAFTEHVALGALPLGVYRITAQSMEDGQTLTATSWALVTRLALVRKTDGNKLLAWVTDIATGLPQANVSLALYDQTDKTSKLLGQTQTALDGTAHLTTTGAFSESEGALIARQGDSLVALNLDLNSRGDEGSGPSDTADEPQTSGNLRAFIYSDRPVYRPGQTVNLKGIGRWFDAQHGFTIPKNQTVMLDVRDAQDTLITHQQVTTNDMGSWNATLALSPEALTGEYSVKAQLGTETNDATFNVAAYQKPEYQATVMFTKDRYIHGEAIEATVTATYFYGAPVSGGKAHIYVTRGDPDANEYGGEGSGTEPA